MTPHWGETVRPSVAVGVPVSGKMAQAMAYGMPSTDGEQRPRRCPRPFSPKDLAAARQGGQPLLSRVVLSKAGELVYAGSKAHASPTDTESS